MLQLQTELEGKEIGFGDLRSRIDSLGYTIGGNWDYHKGSFDNVLWRDEGETIYLRLPFEVVEGELDNYDAQIKFQTPYVIKHVVNIGLDDEENSLLTSTGFNQFQPPVDKDGQIENQNKWTAAGEQAVEKIVRLVQ
ncbi:MAG: YugN family protein [Psychrobacillus psychrotolerans]